MNYNSIKYRIAKLSDFESLAKLHFYSGSRQPGSFIHRLGLPFLRVYYKIHLKDKDSIILVADDENGSVCGFVSGTLSAEKFLKILRKSRLRLLISAVPSLYRFPSLIIGLKKRYDFILLKGKSQEYVITKGPRMDYWAWNSECKSPNSIFLLKAWFDFIYKKEIYSVRGEVDQDNENILNIYLRFGARIFKELKLKDGRTRYFIEFLNSNISPGFRIRNLSLGDLGRVVDIHIDAFQGFFLTLLGKKFLHHLYKTFLYDNYSICLVAELEGEIQGFAIGNIKPASLFRKMLLKQGMLFFLFAIRALLKNPSIVLKRMIYAVNYRGEIPDGFVNPALLSSIGVLPGGKNKGIGSHLVRALCWEAFIKGSDVVYLTTDKFNNDSVNQFYAKNGFHILDEIEKIKGRIMNRYIKLPDEKIV